MNAFSDREWHSCDTYKIAFLHRSSLYVTYCPTYCRTRSRRAGTCAKAFLLPLEHHTSRPPNKASSCSQIQSHLQTENQCVDLSTCNTTDNSLNLSEDLVLIAISHTMSRRATRCLPSCGTGLDRDIRSHKRQFRRTFSFKLIKRNWKEISC